MVATTLPFEGLPTAWGIVLAVCFTVVVAMFLWSLLLFVHARHACAHPPEPPPEGADAFTWVFLVPALKFIDHLTRHRAQIDLVPLERESACLELGDRQNVTDYA